MARPPLTARPRRGEPTQPAGGHRDQSADAGWGSASAYTRGVSTLSDLVHAQGRSSEDDVEWLHGLVGDWQLLADLAFADIVLWVPTTDDDFVAVAHARPSSAATLFYRDFVGQRIKPEGRVQVTDAYRTKEINDTSAPDWYQ